jgi:hypothetical protein
MRYALCDIYLYGQFSADEEHPLARALRPHAKPSTLPGPPHTKWLALQAKLDKEEPAVALQPVERWRWQAVVRAELTDELRAVEAVGSLKEKAGDLDRPSRAMCAPVAPRRPRRHRLSPEHLRRLDEIFSGHKTAPEDYAW